MRKSRTIMRICSSLKMLFAAVILAELAVRSPAAERLPKYNTPEWKQLPGMKEVLAAARSGDPIAQHLLGVAIYKNAAVNNLPLNTVDREWEFLAEKNGYPISQFKPRAEEDVKKLMDFAELGFYEAQRLMGNAMLLAGAPIPACEWYRKAAEQGNDIAQYNLALILVERASGEAEFRQALKWWERSGAQGNGGALKDLGVTYANGCLGEPDIKKAIHYYELAVAAGNAPAAYLLGEIYSAGRDGVAADKDLAIKYFRIAAEKGDQVALLRKNTLQNIVREAEHCRDKGESKQELDLLQYAIDHGSEVAKLGMAINLYEGNSELKPNKTEALRRLKELANTPGPVSYSAQGHLAIFMIREKRNREAVYWYCRSLGNGNPNAYNDAPDFLKTNPPAPEDLDLLRGVSIWAEDGNEEMAHILDELVKKGIVPACAWKKHPEAPESSGKSTEKE